MFTARIDLLRTLSNPESGALLRRVAKGLVSIDPGQPRYRPVVVSRQARHGSIERAVLDTLWSAAGPMPVRQIHGEVESRLGGRVSYSSVKNAVARLVRSGDGRIRRLAPGLYYVGTEQQ